MKPVLISYLFFQISICTFGQVTFEDMIEGSGIEHVGKTYGSSWGDFNGDGLLDLYVSNHYNLGDNTLGGIYIQDVPKIYINLGNNLFSGIQYIINPLEGNDLHGSLVFDFDNDADDDLLITAGGSAKNLFFINDESNTFTLENLSETFNIDLFGGRGRMASVIDLDQNGIVDVVLSNQENSDGSSPSSVLTRQEDGVFENVNADANFAISLASHGTLMDMNGDGNSEFVLLADGGLKILNYQTGAFIEENNINTNSNTKDFLLADFNGDLLADLFFMRGNITWSGIALKDDYTIHALMENGPPGLYPTSFTFESADSIEISIRARFPSEYVYTIHLGSNIIQNISGYEPLVAHPDQFFYQGIQEIDDTQEDLHIFIGRVDGKWKFMSNNFSYSSTIGITVKGQSEIFNLESVPEGGPPLLDNLLLNQGNFQFLPQVLTSLLPSDNSRSGVVGDFDNDMDLDIYVVCATTADNSPNYLLENVNNESWIRHNQAWGATGDGEGIGESVTVADINNDGFLDLFVANGLSVFFLDEARYNLYMNQGNDKNWLGIKLIGQTATRGGYGAVVYAVAGGVKQVRTQNAGEHNRSQNDQRLHFGMAQNSVVDSVIVKWPCGSTQILLNVPVNQYLEIIEEECVLDLSESTNNDSYLEIFPNPTFDWFRISTNYSGEAKIKIFDISGKKLDEFNKYFSGNGGDSPHQLKVLPGVYLVQFLPESHVKDFQKTLKLMVR